MNTAADIRAVAKDWLAFQCRSLPGVKNALVLLTATEHDRCAPAASWSAGTAASPALSESAQLAMRRRQPVVGGLSAAGSNAGAGVCVAALPLVIEGRPLGAAAFEVQHAADIHQRAIINMLQLGVSWLRFLIEQSTQHRTEPLEHAVQVIAAMMQPQSLQAAATAMVTTLATLLGCERVTVGLRGRRHCRALALSHSARFEKRANLIRDIESAMDEALEQDNVLSHPTIDSDIPAITMAQRTLSQQHGGNSVMTVPLVVQQRLIGAITLERPAAAPFDAGVAEHCRNLATLIAPLLEAKQHATQSLVASAARSLRDLGGRLFGRGHHKAKIGVAAGVAVMLWLATATTTYRVTAPASLEGVVQRVIVAPRDGFIGSAEVAAGDVVDEGQLLATLDDKDLQLEQVKWESQREQLVKKHREVRATRDRAEATILEAQIAEADAQVALVQAQLERGELIAPFGGVIVKGDLKHSLGAPVKRGDVLYEVAPLDAYRVIVDVDERSVAEVQAGQPGQLVLTAMPDSPLGLSVEKVTPVATAAEGRNSFRVEARLDEASPELRPGMRGVAKIEIAPRRRVWVWLHSVIDWLRLKTWSWMPE